VLKGDPLLNQSSGNKFVADCVFFSIQSPNNAHFISSGTPYNEDNCLWECNSGFFKVRDLLGASCVRCSTFCDVGQYRGNCNSSADGVCLMCSNGPLNSRYTWPGDPYNTNNCKWECNPGYEQIGDSCFLCQQGKYSSGGTEPCQSCKICDQNAIAKGCGAGSSSDNRKCECREGFQGSGVECNLCTRGKYQSGTGLLDQSGCTLCLSGKYQTGDGMVNSTSCVLCKAGSFQSGSGMSFCIACSPGKYLSAMGQINAQACISCAPGTYQSGSGSVNSAGCIQCGRGTFQSGTGMAGSNSCIICRSGTYQSASGGIECKLCGQGKYQTGLGLGDESLCKPCSAGKYHTGLGLSRIEDCTICGEGTFQTGEGMTDPRTCSLCKPGTYSHAGATVCVLCGAGTFQTREGAADVIECTLCPAGTYQTGLGLPRSDDCKLCSAGTFQTGSGANDCVVCEAGKYQSGAGMANCTDAATLAGGEVPFQCFLNKTWPELVAFKTSGKGLVFSGGLGKRAVPPYVLVWLCTEPSLALCKGKLPTTASEDLVCFTYHEMLEVFQWFGWNSDLGVVKK
jgi:hypothetical protein